MDGRDPGPADPRGAARRARDGSPAGRPRPDDGLAPRRPSRADAASPGATTRRRSSRSSSTRASSTRRPTTSAYPRNEARDLAICEAEGVDLVWAPTGRGGLPARLRHRRPRRCASPGRWRAPPGPATSTAWRRSWPSCSALVGAERAYFGQKDAQQVMVIRQMARDLAIADRGHRLPHRPRAGRARAVVAERPSRPRSSAPRRRSSAGRCVAAAVRWDAGERSGDALRATMRETLAAEPLADVEYVSVADGATLDELDQASTARRCCRWPSASARPASSTTSRSADRGSGRDRPLVATPEDRGR